MLSARLKKSESEREKKSEVHRVARVSDAADADPRYDARERERSVDIAMTPPPPPFTCVCIFGSGIYRSECIDIYTYSIV